MSASRHQRLQALFLEARRLPRDARVVLLERVARDEAELLDELVRLLAHDERPIRFVEQAPNAGGARLLALELATPGETPADPAPTGRPARIARYRTLRIIGEGGMGVVYEAQQDEPLRRVALKVIRPGMITSQMLQRFKQEVHVLGQLQHPGIARIYDAGTYVPEGGDGGPGWPYFAMELVDGVPLLQHAASRELHTNDRLSLIAEICDAVHHAHQKGIVHRDLKPANILVEELAEAQGRDDATGDAGHPKVLDFGVARATDADVLTVTAQTDVGQLVGTVPYMSPEQAAGDPSVLDARSDIYSLGVITFELLSGRLPYAVEGKLLHESLRVIREDEPSRLSSISRSFRGDVETIVAKALEKDPNRRYQSAADLAADIRRYLHHEPIVARPPSAVYQLLKFARRNKAVAAAIAIAFAALTLATAFSSWQWKVADEQGTLAMERAAALDESAWQVYRGSLAAAVSALDHGDPVTASRFLEATDPASPTWEHGYLSARIDQCVALIELDRPVLAAGFADSDGHVLTVTGAGLVERWAPYQARRIESVRLDAPLTGPAALSAGGARLAGIIGEGQDHAAVWDVASGRRVGLLDAAEIAAAIAGAERSAGRRCPARRDDELTQIAISPDGSRVALAGNRGLLWAPDVADSAEAFFACRVTAVAFSDDGHWLGRGWRGPHSDPRMHFGRWDARTDAPGGPAASHFVSRLDAVALSPDGALALLGPEDDRAWLVDCATNEVRRTLGGHAKVIRSVAFGPRGQRVATGSADRTVRIWMLESEASPTILTGHDAAVDAIRFSRDGANLLTVSGQTVRVFAPDADLTTVLRGHELYVYGVAFCRGGSTIVSAAWDGDLRLWDAASGLPLATAPTGARRVLALAASASASVVATGHENGRVKLWDIETGLELEGFVDPRGSRVAALAMSDDGARLAVRTMTSVIVWDLRSRQALLHVALGGQPDNGVALTADGTRVATGAGRDVTIWRVEGGVQLHLLKGHTAPCTALAFSGDGTILASGAEDSTVRLWDVRGGASLHALEGHTRRVFDLAFSPDGTRLASASEDNTILLWDTRRGEQVLELAGHEDYVRTLAFSPDGSMLASGSGDATVRIWDTRLRRDRWRARVRTLAGGN